MLSLEGRETLAECRGDVRRHILRCRVCLVEGRDIVQVRVSEGLENGVEALLHCVEVNEQAVFVERFAGDARRHTPVVPVDGLALTGDDDGVGRGEDRVDGEFVHSFEV